MSTVSNITLDKGGSNSLTVYATDIEEVINKKLSVISPPQSSSNWTSKGGAGVKSTKIIDLIRIEYRITVSGQIDEGDRVKYRNIIQAGGVVTMEWDGIDFVVNFDKFSLAKRSNEDDHREVSFTAIVGVDI